MYLKVDDESLFKEILEFDSNKIINDTKEIISARHTEYSNKKTDKKDLVESFEKIFIENNPLDEEIKGLLKELDGKKISLYSEIEKVLNLWSLLIKKSIMLLRICDLREPYLYTEKKPSPNGLAELNNYIRDYQEFEKLLYATPHYRDHIIHVFKSWLLGISIMIHTDNNEYLENLTFEGNSDFKLSPLEKIAMWTIASLSHDLGYPLEKAQKILHKTSDMMKYFVYNPQITTDISFSDTQDEMNKIILKMMSSKIKTIKKENVEDTYTPVVQPKYYMKFLKSFENNSHGLISSIILYKLLLYFVESEFSTYDGYEFNYVDAEQFLIRREILRAISTHTTKDIYHLNSTTFSFLLMLCDDSQEWERRDWNSMYKGYSEKESKIELEEFSVNDIKVKETVSFHSKIPVQEYIGRIFEYQFIYYKTIFRDGLDTANRSFNFKKTFALDIKGDIYTITFIINKDETAKFTVDLEKISATKRKEIYSKIYSIIDDKKFFVSKQKEDEEKKSITVE